MMAAALFVACSNGSDDGPSYTETLLIGTSYESESVKYSFDSGESFSGTKITASGKTPFKWVATDDGTVSIKFEDGTEETWTYDYTAQTISNESGTFNKLLDFAKFSITPATAVIKYDESIELAIDISPSDGVTYDINGGDDFGVQIENGKLKVQGIVTGEAVMQVTAKKPGYNDKTATAKVTVVPITFTTFAIAPVTVYEQENTTLNITIDPSDDVSYSARVTSGSSNADVKVSDGTITVTGKATVEATIEVTASKAGYSDRTASTKVTVKKYDFETFSITPEPTTVKVGANLTLTAAANPSYGVSYTARVTGGTDKAYVSVTGSTITVTGRSAGEVTIEVTAKKTGYNDKTATKTLTVQTKTFATFEIKDSITIFTDETVYFPITISPSDGVTYSVTKTKIGTAKGDPVTATVENGKLKVTGNSAGTVSVKVTAKKAGYDDKTVTAKVRVNTTPFVGCIVMKDGSYKSAYAITDADKNNAIAVVYKVDTTTRTAWIVGKNHKSGGAYSTRYAWCMKNQKGYETEIVDLITTVSGTEGNYTFDRYIDGSQGLGLLKKFTTNIAGYTAWNWCNSYGTSDVPSDVDSKFKTGWYFPSLAEVRDIWKNIQVVKTSFDNIGGDKLPTYIDHSSSSQHPESDDCARSISALMISGSSTDTVSTFGKENSRLNVLAVRKFTY